ncbi:AEC family transporter [Cetobacterium sp. 2A]|uniref:AEC family transporter n=1 Tax=Cetobacterium sp. 2A TaxID=2754723 RepID=UPI001C8F1970|nr:AEC family transporter [Cetobacterium sp. 2A]
MNILETLKGIFSNNNIVGVVASSILIILLGIIIGRKKLLDKDASKSLTDVVLFVSIPALSFTAFMKDFNEEIFIEGLNIFIWSFGIHLLFMITSGLFYFKCKKDEKVTLEILTTFGGVTAFGIPIVQALYGDIGIIYASIFSIPYRIFLYSYGFIKMSGMKMSLRNFKTIFLNPVILATFLGLTIWLGQNHLPQVAVDGKEYAILRIDKTMYWLYKPMVYLSNLCSPLAWLAAGLKLSEVSFKDALKIKEAWYYSLIKVIIFPLVTLFLIKICNYLGIFYLSPLPAGIVTLMMATPTASVTIAYAIKYNKGAILASSCSLLSTVSSILCLPIIIVILYIVI